MTAVAALDDDEAVEVPRSGWIARLGAIAAVTLVVATWTTSLNINMTYDEGVYAETARLVAAGHPLVSDVFISQPPLWEYLSLPGWLAGGVIGYRVWIMLWGLLGLAAVYQISKVYVSAGLAVAVTVLVAASPAYASISTSIEAEGPALTLAMWSLALILRPVRSRWLIVACGGLFGAALMTKLIVAPMAVVAVTALLNVRHPWRDRLLNVVSFLAGAAAVTALVLIPFWHHGQEYAQVFGFHVATQNFVVGVENNVNTAFQQYQSRTWLLVAGVAAVVLSPIRWNRKRLVPLVWLLATVGFLVTHTPLWEHHLVLAVPPSALLVVMVLGDLLPRWSLGLAVGGVALYCGFSYVTVALADHPLQTAGNTPVVAVLKRLPPGVSLVTDDQSYPAAAGVSVPGPLDDTSWVRLVSGNLTRDMVCDQIAEAKAVLLTRNGRFSLVPGVTTCAREHMRLAWSGAAGWLYLRDIELAPLPPKTRP